jgi:uncharacterized protein YndB with AHSA1/START domain
MPKCVDCKYQGKYFKLEVPFSVGMMMGTKLGVPSGIDSSMVGFEEEVRKYGFTIEDLTIKGMRCQAPGGGPTKDPIVLIQAIGNQPCSFFSQENGNKISATASINRSSQEIWKFITNTNHWQRWWGGKLISIKPGWEQGATIVWEKGTSTIDLLVPHRCIVMSNLFSKTHVRLTTIQSNSTIVELEEELFGLDFNDGGLSEKRAIEISINKLKRLLENRFLYFIICLFSGDFSKKTEALIEREEDGLKVGCVHCGKEVNVFIGSNQICHKGITYAQCDECFRIFRGEDTEKKIKRIKSYSTKQRKRAIVPE